MTVSGLLHRVNTLKPEEYPVCQPAYLGREKGKFSKSILLTVVIYATDLTSTMGSNYFLNCTFLFTVKLHY